ncbi:MAG TPA: hypothetical protein VMU41_02635 [Candidatus Binataceae bacterium]|nr:hypothetical protein [Candidatus Binataceae bacterium]
MADWGGDNLTQFLNRVYANQKGNRANFAGPYSIIQTIDDCFVRAGKNLVNPKPFMAAILLLRAQYAFKAAAGMALAGQVVETFTMMRSVLEYAGYAFIIHGTPALEDVFILRHRSAAEMKAQKKAFNSGAARETIGRYDAKLAEIYDEMYQRTIDFGGHPNPHAAFSAMQMDDEGHDTAVVALALSTDPRVLAHAFKSAAQVGLTALCIFQYMFKEKFELLGIRADIDALKQKASL